LLLGEGGDAHNSYARMRSLGDADTLKSVLPVLQRLLDALRGRDDPIADALAQGIAELQG
jgi:hypothetical protein